MPNQVTKLYFKSKSTRSDCPKPKFNSNKAGRRVEEHGCEWHSPQHGRCIRSRESWRNGGSFCASHTCANLRCRKGKSSRDRCCHSCSATYESALLTIDTPSIHRVLWDNKIHFGCNDCDPTNTRASHKNMCSWVSVHGLCQCERRGRSKYCVFHACPQPKCMKGKSSTKQRCPRHCNADSDRSPSRTLQQKQQHQKQQQQQQQHQQLRDCYTSVSCGRHVNETHFGDDGVCHEAEDFWETLPVRSSGSSTSLADTDTDTPIELESCGTTICSTNHTTPTTVPSVYNDETNHATLLQQQQHPHKHHPHPLHDRKHQHPHHNHKHQHPLHDHKHQLPLHDHKLQNPLHDHQHQHPHHDNKQHHHNHHATGLDHKLHVPNLWQIRAQDHHTVERWSSFDSTHHDVDQQQQQPQQQQQITTTTTTTNNNTTNNNNNNYINNTNNSTNNSSTNNTTEYNNANLDHTTTTHTVHQYRHRHQQT